MKWLLTILIFFVTSVIFAAEPIMLWEKKGQEYRVPSIKFSDDGQYLFISTYKREGDNESQSVQMWDVQEKNLIKEIQCKIKFDEMDVSPGNKYIIGGSNDDFNVELVDIKNSQSELITDVSTNDYLYPGISAVAFSTDGNSFYVEENDYNKIQKFNVQTLEKEEINNFMTKWLDFSENGKYFSTVNYDTSVSVWDIETQTEIFRKKFDKPSAFNTHISQDNRYLVVNHDTTLFNESIQVYLIETGKLIYSKSGRFRYSYSILSNDNKQIFTSTFPMGKLEIWNLETNQISNTDIDIYGPNMIYSPAAHFLTGTDFEYNTNIYNTITQEPVLTIETSSKENLYYCSKALFSQNLLKIYASGSINPQTYSSGKIKIYDLMTGDYESTFPVSPGALMDMYLSKDGKKIVTCGYNGDVYLINAEEPYNMKIEKTYILPKMSLTSVLISNDNQRIFACGNNSGIQYINTETDQTRQFDTNGINIKTMALNSDGSKLIFGTKQKFLAVMEYNADTDEYKRIKTIISDSNTATGTSGISYVGFSKDNRYIIVCASDWRTYIYDAENYLLVNSYKGNLAGISNNQISAALSTNNKKIFIAARSAIRLFDCETQNQLWVKYDFNLKNFSSLKSIVLSIDDKYLSYCTEDGSIGLFDVSEITSVDDIKQLGNEIILSPNPATELIYIQLPLNFSTNENKMVEVFSVLGQKMISTQYKDRIDISSLSSGFYIIKVGEFSGKFVKGW